MTRLCLLLPLLAVACDGPAAMTSPTPSPEASPVVRTDFSSDEAWERLRTRLSQPEADLVGLPADVTFVADGRFRDATPDVLVADSALAGDFFFVADAGAMTDDMTLLAVDAATPPAGPPFRVAVDQVASVQVNLSIANMDWEDFADHVDGDGVFRGF